MTKSNVKVVVIGTLGFPQVKTTPEVTVKDGYNVGEKLTISNYGAYTIEETRKGAELVGKKTIVNPYIEINGDKVWIRQEFSRRIGQQATFTHTSKDKAKTDPGRQTKYGIEHAKNEALIASTYDIMLKLNANVAGLKEKSLIHDDLVMFLISNMSTLNGKRVYTTITKKYRASKDGNKIYEENELGAIYDAKEDAPDKYEIVANFLIKNEFAKFPEDYDGSTVVSHVPMTAFVTVQQKVGDTYTDVLISANELFKFNTHINADMDVATRAMLMNTVLPNYTFMTTAGEYMEDGMFYSAMFTGNLISSSKKASAEPVFSPLEQQLIAMGIKTPDDILSKRVSTGGRAELSMVLDAQEVKPYTGDVIMFNPEVQTKVETVYQAPVKNTAMPTPQGFGAPGIPTPGAPLPPGVGNFQ